MKKILVCLVFVLFGLRGLTQEMEPALARIHYEFYHVHDTLQPDKPSVEEMVLYVGQTSTLYGSFEFNRALKQLENQMADPGFDGNLVLTSGRGNTPSSYYTDLYGREFRHIYQSQGAHYLMDEKFPTIDWVIGEETKQIGGYEVQQATGRFGGREYVVWFTTELPFQGGPWKLQGLPGLVLEAASTDEDVQFTYAGMETALDGESRIGIPANAIATTPQALDRLLEAIKRNPQAASNARGAANQPSGAATANSGSGQGVITFSTGGNPLANPRLDPSRIKSISVNRLSSGRSQITNNPLELKN